LGEALLGRRVADEVAAWRGDREAVIRAPILQVELTKRQLVETDFELEPPPGSILFKLGRSGRPLRPLMAVSGTLLLAALVAVTLISRGFGGTETQLAAAVLIGLRTLFVTAGALLSWIGSRRPSESRQRDLAAQRLVLQRRLEELREEAAKFRTIADADLPPLSRRPLANR
jgi:hypothetical protein